jgi:NAD(P)-dependent dehydrogenase (short-subunit alcohol dehydrogenase family)
MNDVNLGTLIVTGASRGIGAAIARLGATHGYAVCVNYHSSAEAAAAVVGEITAAGGRAVAVEGNVADPEGVENMFTKAEGELGPVSALVNNAGIAGDRARLDDVDVSMLRRVMEVNFIGSFLCSQAAVRRMSLRHGGNGGAIVNISSQVTQSGGRELIPYAASKASVNALMLGLALEVASEGIRVNAVSPGVIDAGMNTFDDREIREKVEMRIPLQRLGTAEEVAEAVLWLLSPAASYVCGAVLPVAGGR